MPNDIYLSSTLDDLQDERAAARDVLGRQAFGIKDSYRASENDLIDSCLDEVAQCAMYVCIVGRRYGHRPPGAANPDDKSITQLEFEQARRLNLPCFVFLKSDNADYKLSHTDAHNNENGAGGRIKDFRAFIGGASGIRPSLFDDTVQLREQLLIAVLNYRRHQSGDKQLLGADERHVAELSFDLALVAHPSDAEALLTPMTRQRADGRTLKIKCIALGPDHPQYMAQLDKETRDCRGICWLLTPPVIDAYRDSPGLLPHALTAQRARRGPPGVLLAAGASAASLPGDWAFGVQVEADAAPAASLDELFTAMRAALPSIRLDRRIGIPCLVLSLTADEASALADDAAPLLATVADPAERALRANQIQQMVAAVRRPGVQPGWPQQAYRAEREDWRPFGPGTPTARDYILRAIQRVNDGELTKRDRLFMKREGLKLQPLWYGVDEYLDDFRGSRGAVTAARDRGCIVLVDEMALLHPGLRGVARVLLKGENVAVLSSQPGDPALHPVSAMLGKDSVLQVGSLITRFRDEHDPRCEVAINSPQRLERWLRSMLPELVPVLAGAEVQTTLANRPDEELFGRSVPT